jgi:hypothetical protein
LKKLAIFILVFSASKLHAQKIEHIYANLYTDSLKKGTHNYINIDGELSNGKFLPLDSSKLIFTCKEAVFFGNSLFIPVDFSPEKVNIKVILKEDNTKFKEMELFIKKTEDHPLKTEREIMAEIKNKKKKKE